MSDWIFAAVASLGLVIQLYAEIFGAALPERMHDKGFYVGFALSVLIGVVFAVWLLGRLSRWLAIRKWLPRVAETQRELVDRAAYIFEHDGFAEEQIAEVASYSPLQVQENQKRNRDSAESQLAQVEKLLEIKPFGDYLARAKTLRAKLDTAG